MNKKYPNVFKPLKIKNMILRNRIFASSGVHAGDIHHCETVSRNGASMICTCMTEVEDEKSYFYPNHPYSFSKEKRDEMKTRIRRIHQGGAYYVLEMTHVGEYYRPKKNDFAWGTQDKVNELGIPVKGLEKAWMEKIANAYAATGKEALALGFDALLFDCSAGWLMSQFLSPHYNQRKDDYGGNIENRARFPMMVLKNLREEIGEQVPIFCQICVNEYFEDGITFSDVLTFLKMAQPYIDGVFAICGNDQNHIQMTKLVTTNLEPHLINQRYTKKLKEDLEIPVALLGGVMSAKEAEEVIANKAADLVGLSRPFIADPCFIKKMMQGEEEDILPCIRCNHCFHVATDYRYIACSINPYYTQQKQSYVKEMTITKHQKHIVVVGAGPAGLRAALSADACGHKVTLIEKEKEVGGMLRFITKEHFKQDIVAYDAYLKAQLKKSKINVMLHTIATPEILKQLRPDKLILAIGANERSLPIKGIDQPHVFLATKAINHSERLGKNIVVIGGGTIGAELAYGLAKEEHKKVCLLEQTDTIAASANHLYQVSLLQHIKECENIRVITSAQCTSIKEKSVEVLVQEKREIYEADSVILAVGLTSRTEEAYALYGIVENTCMIGDVIKPRNIIDATFEGYTSGLYE